MWRIVTRGVRACALTVMRAALIHTTLKHAALIHAALMRAPPSTRSTQSEL